MANIISVQQLTAIAPLLVLTAGALMILLLDVFLKREWRREILSATAILVASVTYLMNGDLFGEGGTYFSQQFFVDRFSQFFALFILFSALAAVVLGTRSLKDQGVEAPAEYHALLLFCVIGAIAFVSAAHFITLFIGLEIMSMALYALWRIGSGKTPFF